MVVRGTAEETAWRQEQRRLRAQADETARVAEGERLEQARREAERIAVQAKIENDRRLAEAAADAQRRKVEDQIRAQRSRDEEERNAREAAAVAERARQADEARRRAADERMRSWLASKEWVNGNHGGMWGRDRLPATLRFTAFDGGTSCSLEIQLPTLNSVVLLQGQWNVDTLIATGNGTRGRGTNVRGAQDTCTWKATSAGSTLSGQLDCGTRLNIDGPLTFSK